MYFFWFLWENFYILFFVITSNSLFLICKSKKKFQGDARAQLVRSNHPQKGNDAEKVKSKKSKKDGHRPTSQAAPTSVPVEKTSVNGFDDTLINVESLRPDISTAPPPK